MMFRFYRKYYFMKFLFVMISFGFISVSYSQTFKSVVKNQVTGNPISLATIYFNGTTVGTYSDENGLFQLDVTKYRSVPITISAIGYYSITFSDYDIDNPPVFYLTPKVYALGDVTITSKKISGKSRGRNLIIFRKEFLGETLNSYKCEIINEDDILFINKSDDTLRAFSLKPILVKNKALGYYITYYLDKFEYCKSKRTLTILGTYIFKDELPSVNKSQMGRIEKKRRSAYLGSRMHFFRSLWASELDKEGFSVFAYDIIKHDYKNLVIQKDSLTKNITCKMKLNVRYKNWVNSYFSLVKEELYFDKNGYFDPFGIVWEGYMAQQRIGDLLPFEYTLK